MLLAGEGFSAQSSEALATLCGVYWYPLYAFIRRQGYGPDEAQDLTQAFFARLLEKKYLRDYARERGRFRSFLLAALKHFLSNERDRSRAQKRGGGVPSLPLSAVIQDGENRYSLEPRSDLTPERIFERQWARALLDHVLVRLQDEFVTAGKAGQFDRLKGFLMGDEARIPYAELAKDFATTENALKVSIHRMRRRFKDVLRDEISHTVADPAEIQEEIRYLLSAVM